MKQFNFFTGRVSDWRRFDQTDVLFFDVTLMTGDTVFAPTGDLLWPYKRGEINDDEYTTTYYRLIQNRIRNDIRPWHWVIHQGAVCFACYCKAGEFCHRHLLKRPLHYLCQQEGIQFIDQGEIFW